MSARLITVTNRRGDRDSSLFFRVVRMIIMMNEPPVGIVAVARTYLSAALYLVCSCVEENFFDPANGKKKKITKILSLTRTQVVRPIGKLLWCT